MPQPIAPNNGVKTHPLTATALSALAALDCKPCPAQELNPGVSNRLRREFLVEGYQAPSPYKSHKLGTTVEYFRITEAGKAALAAAGRA